MVKHSQLISVLLCAIGTWIIFRQPQASVLLTNLTRFPYLDAVLAGALFASTFTLTAGLFILNTLVGKLSLLEIVVFAGVGGMLCDFAILRFLRNNLTNEILPLYKKLGGSHLTKLFHTKLLHWTLPVIGALIIVSPFPDELGVTLLGLSKVSSGKFLLISFLLDSFGVFLVASAISFIST